MLVGKHRRTCSGMQCSRMVASQSGTGGLAKHRRARAAEHNGLSVAEDRGAARNRRDPMRTQNLWSTQHLNHIPATFEAQKKWRSDVGVKERSMGYIEKQPGHLTSMK